MIHPFRTLKLVTLTAVSCFIAADGLSQNKNTLDLSGLWQIRLDPNDLGIGESWRNQNFTESLQLPGSTSSNGKGEPVGPDTKWTGNFWLETPEAKTWRDLPQYEPYLEGDDFLFPFWLIPEKHYVGRAWYQREFTLPKNWQGGTVELVLERCHWETEVWINDRYVGPNNRLGTPHYYDLTAHLSTGEQTITISVDNRIKEINPGLDAHSVTDNTQSNWNGIVGEIKLVHRPSVFISSIQVYPDIHAGVAQLEIEVSNTTNSTVETILALQAVHGESSASDSIDELTRAQTIAPGENTIEIDYPMGESFKLWNEFEANLYQLTARLETDHTIDSLETHFGMREIRADADFIYLNDIPVYFRGTLECAIFPQTGFPPTDVDSWKRIIRICKDFGLNHIRFHSWCPPKAAFIAADELGFYFQIEASAWATIGDGEAIDQWIYEETESILAEYGNHPSFVLMAYGNEPHGKNHKAYLTEYLNFWKPKDKRRLFTSGAGWPLVPENDFHSTHRGTRIQGWAQELDSIINSQAPRSDYDWREKMKNLSAPMISHEIGQWCVYPNFKEIEKYDGVLKPTNFEIFRRSLEANGMLHFADAFLEASGKLQTLCYKADIEAALRTPRYSGFQLLDLHDFPGQGTALVGVLDPFWDEKGYVTAEEYRKFCDTTVPLARFPKRVYQSEEPIEVPVELAHYGPTPLQNVTARWKIVDADQNPVRKGTLKTRQIPIGHNIELGAISTSLKLAKPARLTLHVQVAEFSNSWDLWVYPKNSQAAEPSLYVTDSLDEETERRLDKGETILFSLGKGRVREGKGGEVGIGFSSIFWNTAWTNGQKPHTLGILCDPEHPAFNEFPTEFHSNWQWWDAMSHSDAIRLDAFSAEIVPIVRVIDDWVTNRPLALLLECKVGNGSIILSGIDLTQNLDTRLEAAQLLRSLERYANSSEFAPQVQVSIQEIQSLLKLESPNEDK